MALIKKRKKRKKKVKIEKNKRPKPLLLTCKLTNKTIKVSFKRAEALQRKFNFISIEELQNSFLSKEAIRMLKQGMSEEQICLENKTPICKLPFRIIKKYIKTFKSEEHMFRKRKRKIIKQVVQENNENITRVTAPVTYNPKPIDFKDAQSVAELTKDSCLRPDIYLNNDCFCNGCSVYELCACKLKKWSNKEIHVKRNKKS